MSGSSSGQQWLRAISLVVTKGDKALVLSNLRVRFEIWQAESVTFNTAYIRVYNLSDTTANQIRDEFQHVVLQAGYQNTDLGVIFEGNITQTRHGHESNVDSYTDIFAVDGDKAWNFAYLNKTLEAPASPQQQLDAHHEALMAADPDFNPEKPQLPQTSAEAGGLAPPLFRGKVGGGLSVFQSRPLAMTTNTRISILNNKLVVVPITGYLPSEVVVLNSATGLIGFPEITTGGLRATCLLNPKIKIGQRVQIDNRQLNSVSNRGSGAPGDTPGTAGLPGALNPFAGQFANERADGTYRAMVVEHVGDSRGNEWFSHLVLLDIALGAAPNSSVKAYG